MTFLTCQNNPIYIYFKNNNIKIPPKNPGFHIEEVTTSGLAYMYACMLEHPHHFGKKKTEKMRKTESPSSYRQGSHIQ